MRRRLGLARVAVGSLCLGMLTVETMGRLIGHLPYGALWDDLSDGFGLLGAVFASLFCPQGVHGAHPMAWAYLLVAGNYGFYACLWFAFITLIIARRRRRGEAERLARPPSAGAP